MSSSLVVRFIISFPFAAFHTHATGDNGTLSFWDYDTGTPFQNLEDVPQPGSLEAEAGVFCSTFDMTGTRLITGGADKTIKVRDYYLLHQLPYCNAFFTRFTLSSRNNSVPF